MSDAIKRAAGLSGRAAATMQRIQPQGYKGNLAPVDGAASRGINQHLAAPSRPVPKEQGPFDQFARNKAKDGAPAHAADGTPKRGR